MAWTGIFATAAEVQAKMGSNISTSFTEAMQNDTMAQAESYINCVCRYNFSDNFTSLNKDVKKILSEAAACFTAFYGILYDMSGYTSTIEAEDMVNICWSRFQQCVSLLKDQKVIDFINNS